MYRPWAPLGAADEDATNSVSRNVTEYDSGSEFCFWLGSGIYHSSNPDGPVANSYKKKRSYTQQKYEVDHWNVVLFFVGTYVLYLIPKYLSKNQIYRLPLQYSYQSLWECNCVRLSYEIKRADFMMQSRFENIICWSRVPFYKIWRLITFFTISTTDPTWVGWLQLQNTY